MSLTEHGLKHAEFVSNRALEIAKSIGLNAKHQDLILVASYTHDIGNFLSRTYHHYLGSMFLFEIFKEKIDIKDLTIIMQAVANHDKEEMKLVHPVSAVIVIADKSDVRRERVLEKDGQKIQADIHDRVNYATIENKILISIDKKTITLKLKIDTKVCPIMEYFEIFTTRMNYCRLSAEYLGYHFSLIINNFKLL
ncbi:MAG TPA: HD domain-containing protein [Candidatus Paceibacterota bacterium]|nr:HD domain-containing protein [Candidatus Paceibacterota bacterium]